MTIISMSENAIMIKVFIAAPISGFRDPSEYRQFRTGVLRMIEKLRENSIEVFSEIENIRALNDYDSPGESAKADFARIRDADIFLMVHLHRIQTSTLIELGYAFAINKRIIIVGPEHALPYLVMGLPAISSDCDIVFSSSIDEDTISTVLSCI